MDARTNAAYSKLLNELLTDELLPEGCIPIWRLERAIRDDAAKRAHVADCPHCRRLLSLAYYRRCPAQADIETWANDTFAPERAALLQHIEREDCTPCRDAFEYAVAADAEHPTPWELVRGQLGLLSGPRQVLTQQHLTSGCAMCLNVVAASGVQLLTQKVQQCLAAGEDWRRLLQAAQCVPLAPRVSYSMEATTGRTPMAQVDFPSIRVVLHHDEDAGAVTLEVTTAEATAGRLVRAVVATEKKRWEQSFTLEALGRVAHSSAIIGPPEDWITGRGYLSVLVWLEDDCG